MKDNDVRDTPQDLFEEVQKIYGTAFTLDVCANHFNKKCSRYYTESGLWRVEREHIANDVCGLTGKWFPHWFCNPPFSNIGPWIAKAWEEGLPGLMIIPDNNKEQKFYQRYVEQYRDCPEERRVGTIPCGIVPRRYTDRLSLWTVELEARRPFLENGQPIYAKNKDGSFKLDDNGNKVLGSPRFGITCLIFREKLTRSTFQSSLLAPGWDLVP